MAELSPSGQLLIDAVKVGSRGGGLKLDPTKWAAFKEEFRKALLVPDPTSVIQEILVGVGSFSQSAGPTHPAVKKMASEIEGLLVPYKPKLEALRQVRMAKKRDEAQEKFKKMVPDAPKGEIPKPREKIVFKVPRSTKA